MSSTTTPAEQSSRPESGSTLLFLLGSVVITGILAVAGAHAPGDIRLLGIFPLGFGLLTGWLLCLLAAHLTLSIDRPKMAFIGVMTLTGLVILLCRTVALKPGPPTPTTDPVAAMLAEQLRNSGSSDITFDPSTLRTPSRTRIFIARVQRHLQGRFKWDGSSPWPELLWVCEVLAGVAGSVWIAHRFRLQEPAKQEPAA